ncbi:MAG TPA: tetratricopeptide repeat protein, partial [Rhodanobacteraceae bacterium]
DRFADARKSCETSLALRQRYSPDDHEKIGAALAQCAGSITRHGEYAEARPYFDRALDEFAKAPKVEATERAEVLRGLAELDLQEGKAEDSLKHAKQSLEALASLPPGSPDRIENLRILGQAELANADSTGGVATLQQALDVARIALGEENNKVANVENDLATALNDEDKYREAAAHLEKSIEITEKVRPNSGSATAFARVNLGSIHESLGDYAKAESLMRQGIAALETESPDESQLYYFRGNLARTLMFRGDLAGARILIERSLRDIAARDGEKSFGYAFQEFRLARIEMVAGNLDAAEADLRDVLATVDPLLPPQHALRVQIVVLRGMIAQQRGDLAAAQKELETAETMQMALQNTGPLNLAIIRMRLASVLLARDDLAGARRKLDAALPPLRASVLPEAVERAEAERDQVELVRREGLARH